MTFILVLLHSESCCNCINASHNEIHYYCYNRVVHVAVDHVNKSRTRFKPFCRVSELWMSSAVFPGLWIAPRLVTANTHQLQLDAIYVCIDDSAQGHLFNVYLRFYHTNFEPFKRLFWVHEAHVFRWSSSSSNCDLSWSHNSHTILSKQSHFFL